MLRIGTEVAEQLLRLLRAVLACCLLWQKPRRQGADGAGGLQVRPAVDLPQDVRGIVAGYLCTSDVAAWGRVRRDGIWSSGVVWRLLASNVGLSLPWSMPCAEARDAYRRARFRLGGSQLRALHAADHQNIFQEAAHMARGIAPSDSDAASLILALAEPALHRRDPTCAATTRAAEDFLCAAQGAAHVLGKAQVERLRRAYASNSADAFHAFRELLADDLNKDLYDFIFGEDDAIGTWPASPDAARDLMCEDPHRAC